MILFGRPDGGKSSGVSAWGLEIKGLCSIILLRFKPNQRQNYHSHAFNAITIWLKGMVLEERINPLKYQYYYPGDVKYTGRDNIHKIHVCRDVAWALTFRGPWKDVWSEHTPEGKEIQLTHGRKVV